MLKKILVPVDSIKWDNTLSSIETALSLSTSCGPDEELELIFIHVLETSSKIPISEKDRIRNLKKKKIKEEFGTIKDMCKDQGFEKIRTMTKKGQPDKKIVETAQKEDVNMIVMGSGKLHNGSTKGKINRFVYGSVTENVIHETPCSVLVTKPPKGERNLDRILVPIDSLTFDNTLQAVKEAINFGKGCKIDGGPELVFVHVWNVESSKLSGSEEKRLRNLREDEMEKEFKEIEKMCREEGVNSFKTAFKKGEAAHKEIVKTAREENVNLIIMGSGKLHDRTAKGKIQKFMHGSITEKVIHETPCSIMVVRPRERSNSPEEE